MSRQAKFISAVNQHFARHSLYPLSYTMSKVNIMLVLMGVLFLLLAVATGIRGFVVAKDMCPLDYWSLAQAFVFTLTFYFVFGDSGLGLVVICFVDVCGRCLECSFGITSIFFSTRCNCCNPVIEQSSFFTVTATAKE